MEKVVFILLYSPWVTSFTVLFNVSMGQFNVYLLFWLSCEFPFFLSKILLNSEPAIRQQKKLNFTEKWMDGEFVVLHRTIYFSLPLLWIWIFNRHCRVDETRPLCLLWAHQKCIFLVESFVNGLTVFTRENSKQNFCLQQL